MQFLETLSQYRTYVSLRRASSVLGTSLSECQDKLPLSDGEVDIVTFILLLFSSSVLYTPAPNQVSV